MDGAMNHDVSEVLIAAGRVPEGELVALDLPLGDEIVALMARRRGDELQVWHNVCPHAGRRLDYAPGRFLVSEGRLVCAAHGAQFSLDDGLCIDGPGRGGALAALATNRVPGGWNVVLRHP